MARTTAQLLEQLQRFMPEHIGEPLAPVLGGVAAAFAEVEQAVDELVDDTTIGGAEEEWLTLRADDQGLARLPSETDAELRLRLRNPERQLTPGAILDAVNGLLATYTATEAVMVEWFYGSNFLGQMYLGQFHFAPSPLAFVIFVPRVGDVPNLTDSFLGVSYLGTTYLGSGGVHIAYTQLGKLLARQRAAGIRAWIVVDDTGRIVS